MCLASPDATSAMTLRPGRRLVYEHPPERAPTRAIDDLPLGVRLAPSGSFCFAEAGQMARSSDHSRRPHRGKKALGVIGVSFSLAGAACAESSPADAATEPATSNVRLIDDDLHEQEAFDVGLSSFRLFDREDAKEAKPEQVAWWYGRGCRGCGWGWRGCGCRGCGCRGCGCRGCGCRGCGCRGCGG